MSRFRPGDLVVTKYHREVVFRVVDSAAPAGDSPRIHVVSVDDPTLTMFAREEIFDLHQAIPHKKPKALLWLDLETTGLDPAKHHILEVTAILTKFDHPYAEILERSMLVVGTGLTQLETGACDPAVLDMHTKSGLYDALRQARAADTESAREGRCWGMALVERTLLDVVEAAEDKDERVVLAGSTVSFDQGFLRVHMPDLAKRLSYRTFDTSGLRMFAQSLGYEAEPRGEVAHRTKADVEYSLKLARSIADWFLPP